MAQIVGSLLGHVLWLKDLYASRHQMPTECLLIKASNWRSWTQCCPLAYARDERLLRSEPSLVYL
jgi:hypothetical protein